MTEQQTLPAPQLDALAPYNEIRANIAKMKAENAATIFDYASPKGNKLARSHIYALRQRKADIERVRKETKEDALQFGKKVDAVARELVGEVEAMIAVHEKPLLEIEERETARALSVAMPMDTFTDVATCKSALARIEAVKIDDTWTDKERHQKTRETTLTNLRNTLAALEKRDADQAELARLREEQSKRDAEARARAAEEATKKREEEIRAAAEAKAKREAEQAAQEAQRKAADAAMAEARKKEAEAQAAINAEREKTRQAELQAEKARREKAEAEAKAAREEREKQAAQAAREADKAHRARVLAEAEHAIAAGISSFVGEKKDAETIAAMIVDAIAAGKVPHVSIKF
jgi:colicin import membrane protein